MGHRKTNPENMDIFFVCSKWDGEVTNKEPKKCRDLRFFEIETLPVNMVEYIFQTMGYIKNKIFYSEQGWD